MREWLEALRESLGALWGGLAAPTRDSIVATAITILIATAAALLVTWQVGRQARRALDGRRQIESMRLKKDVYKDIQGSIGACLDARLKLKAFVHEFLLNVDIYRKDKSARWTPNAQPSRLVALFGASTQTVGDLVGLLGRLKIIDPRMDVFPVAFNSALYDVRLAFQSYADPATRVMALQARDNAPAVWMPPGDRDFDRFERASQDLLRTLEVLGGYLADLEIEIQNVLLGPLFKRQLAPRTPANADDIVIRLDRHKELSDYFLRGSPWGVDMATAENDSRKRQVEREAEAAPAAAPV